MIYYFEGKFGGVRNLHEEKLPASDKLLGVQLWINMPIKYKMAYPEYHSIKKEEIKEIPIDGGDYK